MKKGRNQTQNIQTTTVTYEQPLNSDSLLKQAAVAKSHILSKTRTLTLQGTIISKFKIKPDDYLR